MQIFHINLFSLEEKIAQMRMLKEQWETTPLESYQVQSSGASAIAFQRVMDEYEQLRTELITLINITLSVLENTEETFEKADNKLASSILGAFGGLISRTYPLPTVTAGVIKSTVEAVLNGPLHTGNNHPVPNTATGAAKAAAEAVLNSSTHTGNNHPVPNTATGAAKAAAEAVLGDSSECDTPKAKVALDFVVLKNSYDETQNGVNSR